MSTTHTRTHSSPGLLASVPSSEQYDDSALEGVAANVKLLLKLIHDHKDACKNGQNDSRRMLRVAGMMTVLDNVRNRIQKCQSFGNKKSIPKLRRCNTDVKDNPPREKKAGEGMVDDDKARLRKDLNASSVARKSLELMCSSIGKEKEIMAAELARKNYELSELEQHVSDLKRQNETLLQKVKEFAADHEDKKVTKGKGEFEGNVVHLQIRNEVLSEQLHKSLDGYRSMKKKLRYTQEEAVAMHETMEKMSEKVGAGLQLVRTIKQQIETKSDDHKLVCFKEGTSETGHVFECLQKMVSKHVQRKE